MTTARPPWIKILLSVFILFQILVITCSPNPGSILERTLQPIFLGYAGTFGFYTPWRFYAPNPAPQRHLVIENKDDYGNVTKTWQWPPEERKSYWIENYGRLIYHSYITTQNLEYVEKYFKPWVCRKYPSTFSFTIKPVIYQIDTLARTGLETSESGSREDMLEDLSFPPTEYQCQEMRL